MKMPPLLADFTHARPCKPFCEKYLTLPFIGEVNLAGDDQTVERQRKDKTHDLSAMPPCDNQVPSLLGRPFPCSELFCDRPARPEYAWQEVTLPWGIKANLLSVFPPNHFLFGVQHVVVNLPGLYFQVAADAVGNGLVQFM